MAGNKETQDSLEALIGDPAVCRLYLGFSKLDCETADALRKGGTYSHWKATRTCWISSAACSKSATARP